MELLLTFAAAAAILFLVIPGASSTNISGGAAARPHSRPYMAFIKSSSKTCGGILVKDRWVLTAAHCNITKTTEVILGAHSISRKEPEQQKFKVVKSFPYPCYSWNGFENDLMLLQLNGNIKRSKAVSPCPLPSTGDDDVKAGTKCQAAGWGVTDRHTRGISNILMEVNIVIMNRNICNGHYKSRPAITRNMLCAGDTKGTCKGDSGGPLICNGTLRGITAFGGNPCSTHKQPGVFTRLTDNYLNWIKKTTGGDL
ncbi:granzyme A-like [Ambystoma mexicanum]|uniref:granzyme A-like n=1 Tax=Ambystoma mexicanum TaxID=8296 RepID=UPI0037E8C3B9